MSPAPCDILYACPVIALLSCVSCVCLCYCVCLFDELCALHVTSVTLLAHSVQMQLFLLRNVSECGLRRTATTEQWYSYGECKSAMHRMFVKCL